LITVKCPLSAQRVIVDCETLASIAASDRVRY
jgi:hypothetical protein